ncbi:P2Y purinoceptor 14 [Manis javanica]|nr:P2Y purinoceptor 14 [Manis javanica]
MNATTTAPPAEPCFRNTLITQRIVPVLYFLVFIAGILLNGVSGWIFFYVPSSKSFIIYLKSIVAADFLMSLTFPFKILGDSGLGPWQLRVFVCRVSAVLFYVNMYVSIVFFGLIGFDRYGTRLLAQHSSKLNSFSVINWLQDIQAIFQMFLNRPRSETQPTEAQRIYPQIL